MTAEDALARIEAALDRDELCDLVLTLSNIPSGQGHEAQSGAFVYDWMQREGFRPRRIAAVPHRFSVIGEYGGMGHGPGARNLLFSSHLAMRPAAIGSRMACSSALRSPTIAAR